MTADALAKLNPQGGSGPADAAVYTVGDVAAPQGYRTESLPGGSPAEAANAIDLLRESLLKADPARILIASADQAPVRDARRGVGGALGRTRAVRRATTAVPSRPLEALRAPPRRADLRARARRA